LQKKKSKKIEVGAEKKYVRVVFLEKKNAERNKKEGTHGLRYKRQPVF
jgi:hypothetical protein